MVEEIVVKKGVSYRVEEQKSNNITRISLREMEGKTPNSIKGYIVFYVRNKRFGFWPVNPTTHIHYIKGKGLGDLLVKSAVKHTKINEVSYGIRTISGRRALKKYKKKRMIYGGGTFTRKFVLK
ncbi:MAG: hypothetical protein ABH821_02880 [archaeon]